MSTLRELELEQASPLLLEVLRKQGLASLSSFQIGALNGGILRGVSQLLITYDYDEAYQIAEIALLDRLLMDYKAKALVLCPNANQAEKRFSSLSQKCSRVGIEASEAIRRRTAIGQDWVNGRVVVGTYSSMNIALSARSEMLDDIQIVLIERLDLIGLPDIGASLEAALVKIMSRRQGLQYVAVSPPVADLKDLGAWLRAEIVEDTKPQVKRIFSVKAFSSMKESLADLAEFIHYRRGQTMILCSNIASCQELAAQLAGKQDKSASPFLDLRLTPMQRDDLNQLTRRILEKYPNCETTHRLRASIPRGVAFLHEGVSRVQRRAISAAWNDDLLPVLVMPTRFAIASGLKATVVFLIGVYMRDLSNDVMGVEELTMLSEWQLNDVLQSAGRAGVDNEAFAIVVVENESERKMVLSKFFTTDAQGDISSRLGEVDSSMDDPENMQDLVTSQLCGHSERTEDPLAIISRTFWAATNRLKGITQESMMFLGDSTVEDLISFRTTRSTFKHADEIPDSSVRFVSVTPTKIEGLVHSGTREMWHYVTLKSDEGVSCSCESWKYQGIRNHRLCKHLAKFCTLALRDDETKPYAASVIGQALHGLSILDEMEQEGLLLRDGKNLRCTGLGQSAAALGVPVRDAKKVMKALSKGTGRLRDLLPAVTAAKTGLPEEPIKRCFDSILAKNAERAIECETDMPGIVENILEELHYANSILLKLMASDARRGLNKESFELQKDLSVMLADIS